MDQPSKNKNRYMYVFQIPWIPELILQSRDNFAIRYSAKEGFVAGPNQKKDIEAYLYYYSQPGINAV